MQSESHLESVSLDFLEQFFASNISIQMETASDHPNNNKQMIVNPKNMNNFVTNGYKHSRSVQDNLSRT